MGNWEKKWLMAGQKDGLPESMEMVMSVVRKLNEGHAWTVTEGTYITYLYVLEFEPRSKIFGVTIPSRKAFCFSTKRKVTGKHGDTPHCQG